MTRGTRMLGGVSIALSFAACTAHTSVVPTLGQSALAGARVDDEARIVVEVEGLRSSGGLVKCDLFEGADGFPRRSDKAKVALRVPIREDRAECVFAHVPPGIYAVGFLHDENANGTMDSSWLGIPKEGQGASNDAQGSLGPPSFDDAKFRYAGGLATMKLKTFY